MFLDKEYIGKKFKEYRKKSKLSQEKISELAQIAEKHYGRLERGICLPSLVTFFKICSILQIPLSDFGITQKEDNALRKEFLQEIYLLSENELSLYLNIIKNLRNNYAK